MRNKKTIDVENLNETYPQWPKTIEDKGWIYGVWYCGTSYVPVTLYGQYPPTFLKRVMALFPTIARDEILHCPSGQIAGGPEMTVDLRCDDVRRPKVVADAYTLPFGDHTFSLILSDPPYHDDVMNYREKYNCPKWQMRKAMKEFHRVLTPGGYLAILDTRYPVFRRLNYDLKGLIAVVSGAGRRTRMFSIFERSHYRAWREPQRRRNEQKEMF